MVVAMLAELPATLPLIKQNAINVPIGNISTVHVTHLYVMVSEIVPEIVKNVHPREVPSLMRINVISALIRLGFKAVPFVTHVLIHQPFTLMPQSVPNAVNVKWLMVIAF